MTSLIKKRKDGRDYYYAVRSARVDGKPRIVWQKYLGPVDEVVRKLADGDIQEPDHSLSFEFGGPAALLSIAEELGLKEIIDGHVPKREQGPTVGDYILLCAINRVLGPASKAQLAEWYEGTVLQRLWKFSPDCFTSQNLWHHMDRLGEAEITAIETDVTRRVIERCNLSLDCLLYDATNFFTYIDSRNDRCTIAQRGHSKEKRADLRIVGLALVVTRAFKIPIFHQPYGGNISDSTQFPSVVCELADRFNKMSKSCDELTLVFDKGNNSQDGLLFTQIERMHFVGSLTPTDHPKLLEIPLEKYEQVSEERWPGVRAHRSHATAMGQDWPCVITFSEHFYSQQLHGWVVQLTKATSQLEQLNKNVSKDKNGRRTKSSVEQRVKEILAPLPFRDIVTVNIIEHGGGRFSLKYQSDTAAFNEFVTRRGGKTILFTDHEGWSNDEIIASYRGQAEIEGAFRLMKADDYLHWQPMYHWTDSKIRVHAFYCVLALLLVSVLTKRLHGGGLNLTPEKILDTLSDMDETVLVYPGGKKQGEAPVRTTYTKLTPKQKKICDILGLDKWRAPKTG
jgi:transposase